LSIAQEEKANRKLLEILHKEIKANQESHLTNQAKDLYKKVKELGY